MPRELIATAPGQAALQEYQEPDLAVGEIRIQTIFSSVNHGSGRRSFRADSKDYTSPFDCQRGIHHGPHQFSHPIPNHWAIWRLEKWSKSVVRPINGKSGTRFFPCYRFERRI